MRRGDRLRLALGTKYDWVARASDENIVALVPETSPPPSGTQGAYEALRAGETDLNAQGGLHCDPDEYCPLLLALFRVHLVVDGQVSIASISLGDVNSDAPLLDGILPF
jgi:hypothetical protein